jgi:aminopeptidase C
MPPRKARPCVSPPRPRVVKPKLVRQSDPVSESDPNMKEIQKHFTALEKSKLGVLAHVASQHSVLDVLYGGDAGRPMPSWTHQTTPEVSVSDQQHTGRCWIFATLAVLGHVFRAQYGISNRRATFSEGYLGFWDLYEKSRLFLKVAYDTRCTPLDDPSLCDLLKSGISDGGDFIFCLNLLDRYGIVPTEYYPNSSYGSMSTEALVTLVNQVLRDNVITLRSTGDERLITPMLTNIFAILCMGLGTPPAPWKKLDWQIDQCETFAQFAADMPPTTSELPPETVPWRQSQPKTFAVTVPAKPTPPPAAAESLADIFASLDTSVPPSPVIQPTPQAAAPLATPSSSLMDAMLSPPSPTGSAATVAPLADDEESPASSATIVDDEPAPATGEPQVLGLRPPRVPIDIPSSTSTGNCVDLTKAGVCKKKGIFTRFSPADEAQVPQEGSGSIFKDLMPDKGGCLMGQLRPRPCRLAHTITERPVEEEAMSFDYTPRDFYYRFLNSVKFVPVVCDPRFPPGTRIISNDANMYGGLPSQYLNVTIKDIEHYTIESLKRNIPVWFACDVKKQLTPEGGRMCSHTDRLSELLPEPHRRGTKLQEIQHFNAIANHALLISAVSMKAGKPIAWRIVNSWGEVGRNAGVFVACEDWFRDHVYSVNVVYDTLSKEYKADLTRKVQPTIRLGPFDPSVI